MSCLPNPLRALVCFVCFSLMAAHGHAKKVDREPLDLSVIKESSQLLPFMTASQKVEFYQLETTLLEAQSNLRSGQTQTGT